MTMTIPIPNGNDIGSVAGRSSGASYPSVEYDAKTVKEMGNWSNNDNETYLINLIKAIKDEMTEEELERKKIALG